MGQDLEGLMNSDLGQPMAQIFLNGLGQEGTLVLWSFVILVQYMMGSSMVYFLLFLPIVILGQLLMMLLVFCRCSLRLVNLSPCMSSSWLYSELLDCRLTLVLSARDGALPFSDVLYRMNKFTKTPFNTVLFCAAGSIALGALIFAGTQAINAVFSISITAQYIAFSMPIAVRWIWRKDNGWTPGAFSLGAWVSAHSRF
jgi:amino acid transporter